MRQKYEKAKKMAFGAQAGTAKKTEAGKGQQVRLPSSQRQTAKAKAAEVMKIDEQKKA